MQMRSVATLAALLPRGPELLRRARSSCDGAHLDDRFHETDHNKPEYFTVFTAI